MVSFVIKTTYSIQETLDQRATTLRVSLSNLAEIKLGSPDLTEKVITRAYLIRVLPLVLLERSFGVLQELGLIGWPLSWRLVLVLDGGPT